MALAQERWDGQFQIWCEGTGTGELIDPCFGRDTSEIILTYDDLLDSTSGYRITVLDISEPYNSPQLLPESLSIDGYNDISPFMTGDGSRLYFASDRPGGFGGYDIYLTEFVNSAWQIPVNLGPNINSPENDVDAVLNGDESEIYLARIYGNSEYSILGALFSSTYDGTQWALSESLTAPINSQYLEGKPTISFDATKLYFISGRPGNEYAPAVWVSYREGSLWSQPSLLQGFVNHYWLEYAFLLEGAPMSVALDATGLVMLYSKMEVFLYFDPEVCAYTSYYSTATENDNVTIPTFAFLSLYPNPFNSSLHISIQSPADGKLFIYDITGRVVKGYDVSPPHNEIIWNGRSDDGIACPSGVYFVKLQGVPMAQKAVLLK